MIGLVLFVLMFIILVVNFCKTKNAVKEPPSYPGALPIIGHLHLLWGNSAYHWELFKKLYKESLKRGGAISTYTGPLTAYILTDPDDCLMVANACLEKSSTYNYLKSWLGEGLITARLATWKIHRKLLSPAFNQIVLDGFMGVFNQQSRKLVKDMEIEVERGGFDHSTYLNRIFLENIILTSMGIKGDYEDIIKNEYIIAVDKMIQISTKLILHIWMSLTFGSQYRKLRRKYDKTLRCLREMSGRIIQMKKLDRNGNCYSQENAKDFPETKFKAFLDQLIVIAKETGDISEKDIQEHVDTMVLAGYETLANSLLYVIIMIGSDLRVQDLIYEELLEVFGDSDRDVVREDLSKLVYLEAVIKESLRLYPVAPLVSRRLDKDIKLKNYTLLAGRDTMLFIYGIHRHQKWGPDAEEYRPERWLNPSALPEIASAFAPFSLGRRSCIGKTYAMMAMKTTLSHLLRNYKITADRTKLVLKLEIFLKPISGHHISIDHRTKRKIN